jgi:hypothetical protein
MSTNYETRDDVEITEDHKDFLREAGASHAFMEVLATDTDSRHSVREKVKSHIYWGDLDAEAGKSPETFKPLAGHFFNALWDGDLFHAWVRADLNNKPLMLKAIGKERIVEYGIRVGEPKDYMTELVEM